MSLQTQDIRSLPQAPSQHSLLYGDSPTSPDEKDLMLSESPQWAKANATGKAPKVPSRVMDLVKSLLLPAIAIAYLTFCYIVHYRVVPVNAGGIIDTSPAHISAIKSGLTSISILIIGLGLWPLKELVENIKSEEFFRTLRTHNDGVPLAALNGISVPSFGTVDTVMAISRRHTSPYLTLAFIGGLLSIATSTLAPAALSVDTVLVDSDLMAFKVGAVLQDSVLNVTDNSLFQATPLSRNNELAASIAWAETFLGVRYSFTQRPPDSGVTPYIVPWPADLDLGTSARWLTDVVALRPTCIFSNTNSSAGIDFRPGNLTVRFNDSRAFHLTDSDIDVKMTSFSAIGNSPNIRMLDASLYLSNHTTQTPLSDGSVTWQLSQCVTGCSRTFPESTTVIKFDLSGVPKFQMIGADATWEVAFLVCSPHSTIETREVRSDSQGILTVNTDNKKLAKQGNLRPAQTALLLTLSMSEFGGDKSGPSFLSLGSKALASLIFGNDQVNNVNTTQGLFTLTPLQQNAIGDSYIRILQSITKVYMTGMLGTAYVPGRLSRPSLVFRSSMSVLGVSTALFALLTILILAAHFRSGKGEQFTLSRVAAALDKSDIPSQFAHVKQDPGFRTVLDREGAGHLDANLIQAYGNNVLVLDKNSGNLRLKAPVA